MMKWIIGLMIILVILNNKADACSLNAAGVITNQAICAFVLGAKISVSVSSSRTATFNLEVIANYTGNPTTLLSAYVLDTGNSQSYNGNSYTCTAAGAYQKCSTTISHPYSAARSLYTYTWHVLSRSQSPFISYSNINTTVFDFALKGNVTVDNSAIISPIITSSPGGAYYTTTPDSPLQIGDGSYCTLGATVPTDRKSVV